jgi:hypothetical protein
MKFTYIYCILKTRQVLISIVDFTTMSSQASNFVNIVNIVNHLTEISKSMDLLSDWEKSLMLVVFKKAADKMPHGSIEKDLTIVWLKQYSYIPETEESLYLLAI